MSEKRKLIKIDVDMNITVHDFPDGSISEQNKALRDLIGNGCDIVEPVMPRRLYTELGHAAEVKRKDSKRVIMLVDEEFLLKNGLHANQIGSYLYETDKHGNPILGNILFVGEAYGKDGIDFVGIEEETFKTLHTQLKNMVFAIRAAKEVKSV